ncbi:uncharacterized protein HD556DRAFT_1539318 [Suillus plorans]|uniref:Uncharacterized protein n=1 Tax=Suillus plorans TaxID=116603 RepID=A0A9P7DC95_9AGAM|nr:uncharacterized protein HD556DRAFT_1539318 [Suillus plorans]KAG1787017.1 hypothetical protein HD556DRAFT_1539318 [Suillus plorans]
MKELDDATGIDARALVAFRPGMSGAREKLQRASKRVTTVQEDVAYSSFDIFAITLPIVYGERKQEARSDGSCRRSWPGQATSTSLSSTGSDNLPSSIAVFQPISPLIALLHLSSSLRKLQTFISFHITEIRRRRGLAQETLITYGVKADGPHGLLITTEETLVQFSWAKPIRQTFLPVRPWDRYLLGVPDFAEQRDFAYDMESMEGRTEPGSLMDESDKLPGGSPVEEEPSSLALQLQFHPRQPFD